MKGSEIHIQKKMLNALELKLELNEECSVKHFCWLLLLWGWFGR